MSFTYMIMTLVGQSELKNWSHWMRFEHMSLMRTGGYAASVDLKKVVSNDSWTPAELAENKSSSFITVLQFESPQKFEAYKLALGEKLKKQYDDQGWRTVKSKRLTFEDLH